MNNLTFAVSSVPEENHCGMACWHTHSQCDSHSVVSFSPAQQLRAAQQLCMSTSWIGIEAPTRVMVQKKTTVLRLEQWRLPIVLLILWRKDMRPVPVIEGILKCLNSSKVMETKVWMVVNNLHPSTNGDTWEPLSYTSNSNCYQRMR